MELTKTEIESLKQMAICIKDLKEKYPEYTHNFKVVGFWLWAEFQTKPAREVLNHLKEMGFRWNNNRKVWQNPFLIASRSTSGDPRLKYGSKEIEQIAV